MSDYRCDWWLMLVMTGLMVIGAGTVLWAAWRFMT
jgi:hypothetical protein